MCKELLLSFRTLSPSLNGLTVTCTGVNLSEFILCNVVRAGGHVGSHLSSHPESLGH